MGMKRFWISWEEPANDEWDGRPLKVPSKKFVPGYWETGVSEDAMMYCAVVNAPNEERAKWVVLKYWGGDDKVWRFCNEEAADWMPPEERFPRTQT